MKEPLRETRVIVSIDRVARGAERVLMELSRKYARGGHPHPVFDATFTHFPHRSNPPSELRIHGPNRMSGRTRLR